VLGRAYPSLEALSQATEEELAEIHEIGPILASSIRRYFGRPQTRQLMDALARNGLSLEACPGPEEERVGQALEGLTFVLTGTLPTMTRAEARGLIESEGGRVTSSVSTRTSYLVAGDDPGSKQEKAVKLGIPILDEPGFLQLIEKRRAGNDPGPETDSDLAPTRPT
jgi:DNA ligase (NAD+)